MSTIVLGMTLASELQRPLSLSLSMAERPLGEHIGLNSNPATGLSKFYKQAPTLHEEIEPLAREEVPLFLQSVSKHSSEYFALFLCAIHTGLRSGELAALQWGDLDFHGSTLCPTSHGDFPLGFS